jgi:hypothetical protein
VRARDHGDETARGKALDIIDELLKVAAFGIGEATEKYERQGISRARSR